jgi:CheY-like chemotaxis protein
LCVDDETSIRQSYNHILTQFFKKVFLAKDGEEALKVFKSDNVDLVLTDYMMPNMNGLELTKEIRKIDKTIPVILVTAMKESEILKEALNINTTHFLNKPIEKDTLLTVLFSAAKNFLADMMLKKEQEKKIKTLEASREYSQAQERMAFEKELHIIRNDRYYELANQENDGTFTLIDICYKPLDVLSGDSFSIREIDEKRDIYFLVDAMGKGMSASTTAMLTTSYLNHTVDVNRFEYDFNLKNFVNGYLDYIKKFLLDDEMLALIIVEYDRINETIKVVNFAMPPALLIDKEDTLHKIGQANLPVSKYIDSFEIATLDIKGFKKFLIASDGIYETLTKDNTLSYKYIQEDLQSSSFKFEFEKKFFDRIDYQDDDVTFIMLNRIELKASQVKSFVIDAKLEEIKKFHQSIIRYITTFFQPDPQSVTQFEYAFYELLMNAYEHGSLGVSGEEKQKHIAQDSYIEYLKSIESQRFSQIFVKLYYYKGYVIASIKDEGKGFDLNKLRMEYLVEKTKFSGRGIKSSRKMVDSLFYNLKSNEVMIIKNMKGVR